MSGTAFCGACGTEIPATARFCRSCGTSQQTFVDQVVAPPSGPGTPTARGGTPFRDASDFAQQVAGQVQAPGALTALISGAMATGICLAVGLVLSIAFQDQSAGFHGDGLVGRWLSETVGFLLVGFDSAPTDFAAAGRVSALTLVAVPIGASALAAGLQADRTAGMAPWLRIAWGAATAIPLALAMLVIAAATSDPKASIGGAFVLALLWGALGGAAGVAWRLRGVESRAALTAPLPTWLRRVLSAVWGASAPLLVAWALAAIIGTGVWLYQTVFTEPIEASSALRALDLLLYAGDNGVNYLALGFGVDFSSSTVPPIPGVGFGDSRLFDYGGALPPYTFIPLLLILMLIPLVFLVYSGFACSRAAGAANPREGAAWGLLVGPVWALTLVTLNAMAPRLLGAPSGETLFGLVLFSGLTLGALGGLMGGAPTGRDR